MKGEVDEKRGDTIPEGMVGFSFPVSPRSEDDDDFCTDYLDTEGVEVVECNGGAWKVAYADFVTAMMALFMVLWIVAQDQEILLVTSQYFKNPFNSPLDMSVGVMEFDQGSFADQRQRGTGEPSSAVEVTMLRALAQEFEKVLNLDENVTDRPIEMEIDEDQLKLTVFDQGEHMVFKRGSVEFTQWGDFVMQNLSWLMERYELNIRIDAHMPGGFASSQEFGPFELTAERANAVRRRLVYYALDPSKIYQVVGNGDRQPLENMAPDSDRNQRIEISLLLDN